MMEGKMELKLTKEAMEQIDQYSRDRGTPCQ